MENRESQKVRKSDSLLTMEQRSLQQIYNELTSFLIDMEIRKETTIFRGLDFRLYVKLSKINPLIRKKIPIRTMLLDQTREDLVELERMFLLYKIQEVNLLREAWNVLTLIMFPETALEIGRYRRNLKHIKTIHMLSPVWTTMMRPVRISPTAGLRWRNPLNDTDFLRAKFTKIESRIYERRRRELIETAEFVYPTPNYNMGLPSSSEEEIRNGCLHPPILQRFRSGRIRRGNLFEFPHSQMQTIGRIWRTGYVFPLLNPLDEVRGPRSLVIFCLISLLEQDFQEDDPLLRDVREIFSQLKKCRKCRNHLTHFLPGVQRDVGDVKINFARPNIREDLPKKKFEEL